MMRRPFCGAVTRADNGARRGRVRTSSPSGPGSRAKAAIVGRGLQEHQGASWHSRQGIHEHDGVLCRLAEFELHRLSWQRERERLGELCDRHAAEDPRAPDDHHGEGDQRRQLRRPAVRDVLHVSSWQPEAEGHPQSRRAVRRAAARRSRRNRNGAGRARQPLPRIRFSTSTSRRLAARRRWQAHQLYRQRDLRRLRFRFRQSPVDIYAKAPNLRAMVVHRLAAMPRRPMMAARHGQPGRARWLQCP